MQLAAIYARYSDEQQRETSIDDQVRRCKEVAARHGYVVPDNLVFYDAAVTGQDKGLTKRPGYAELLLAWTEKRFAALVVDEVSRMARSQRELLAVQERIEKSGVRLLSADGLDSQTASWQLQFGIVAVIAAHFTRELRHRVTRGMQGQLERGFQIGAPPMGYRAVREYSGEGAEMGTRWEICEPEAQVVREIFTRKLNGQSLAQIARWLNTSGVPARRQAISKSGIRGADGELSERQAFWRPSAVRSLLRTTSYRGVFVWHGSEFIKARAKKEGRALEPVEYLRPHLRLVSDEVWHAACGRGGATWMRRGVQHPLAGVVLCGFCESRLSISRGGTVPTMFCSQCAMAQRVGGRANPLGYTSARAVQLAIEAVIKELLSPAAIEAFREGLRARLRGEVVGGPSQHDVDSARRTCERLARLLRDCGQDDAVLEAEYRAAALEHRRIKAAFEAVARPLSTKARLDLERQVAVDPRTLVSHLFTDAVPAAQVQVTLRRLFPRIVYYERPSKHKYVFEVESEEGALYAGQTPTVEGTPQRKVWTVEVRTSARRPVAWTTQVTQR